MTQTLYGLDDILSITTGRLLSRRHVEGLYDILNYMTGDNLMTHQLPRAATVCGPALLDQHPQLRDVAPPEGDSITQEELFAWLDRAEEEYGKTLPVQPVASDVWESRNPIEELIDMVGPKKVAVVVTPDEGKS
jgi:hypothetical protein